MKTSNLLASTVTALAITAALSAPAVWAGPGHAEGHHGEGSPNIGQPGDAEAVSRTIEVTLSDNYYEPEEITVEQGETVRFIVTNTGAFVHEFNIGTAAMHDAHQEEMMMMMEHGVLEPDSINHDMMKMDMGDGHTMDHDDPNSVLLEPGESADIVWTFSEATDLEFACNIPGHYQAGMVGQFHFE